MKAYITCLFVFCIIDFFWVGIVAKEWYRREIGHLLVDSIRWIPVVAFYLLYGGGILAFVVHSAVKSDSWQYALLYGAYDLTNLSTLKN